MTKFGKFKLRLIATINLSVLLSVFNIASTTSNYWIKYKDQITNEYHFAGMWRSCPNQGPCVWKNGIISYVHTIWSLFVRLFITLGTTANIFVVVIFFMALIYKINKRSRAAIRLLEIGNLFLIGAFVSILIGFCIFISTSISFSMWLLVLSMIICFITSNMLTRNFATLYFQNTRFTQCSKSVEAALSQSKLAINAEEKIALTQMDSNENGNGIASIEMSKVSDANGSNEALIPSSAPLETPTVVVEVKENELASEQSKPIIS